MGGIVVGFFCTFMLFVFDEAISTSQKSKIVALETRLAPRELSKDQQKQLGSDLRLFAGKTVRVMSYTLVDRI